LSGPSVLFISHAPFPTEQQVAKKNSDFQTFPPPPSLPLHPKIHQTQGGVTRKTTRELVDVTLLDQEVVLPTPHTSPSPNSLLEKKGVQVTKHRNRELNSPRGQVLDFIDAKLQLVPMDSRLAQASPCSHQDGSSMPLLSLRLVRQALVAARVADCSPCCSRGS
jgi:hypothetical protein